MFTKFLRKLTLLKGVMLDTAIKHDEKGWILQPQDSFCFAFKKKEKDSVNICQMVLSCKIRKKSGNQIAKNSYYTKN